MGIERYRFTGKEKYHAGDVSPRDTALCENEEQAAERMEENQREIARYQDKLYAAKREGLAIVFQAQDAAGKDGTIRSVLSCLSPHGVKEFAFKKPSETELAHDFLWRVSSHTPEKGEIMILNRSHYEDVLVGRVHKLYEHQAYAARIDRDKILEYRYEDIRNFEAYLTHNNVKMIKLFLNVSREEQKKRFLARIDTAKKNWKFSGADIEERRYWDEYQKAYEAAINKTATKDCPWYVIPADNKWYMRYLVSEIVLDTLREMDPHYPDADPDTLARLAEYRASLEAETE